MLAQLQCNSPKVNRNPKEIFTEKLLMNIKVNYNRLSEESEVLVFEKKKLQMGCLFLKYFKNVSVL